MENLVLVLVFVVFCVIGFFLIFLDYWFKMSCEFKEKLAKKDEIIAELQEGIITKKQKDLELYDEYGCRKKFF